MDWSIVFEEDGEEQGNWEVKKGVSRVTFLEALETSSYTPIVSYLFTVNYILGVGVLGMPWAFLQAGVVQASLIIIFCSIISWITVVWVANAAYWGMQTKILQKGNPFKSPVQTQALRVRTRAAEDKEISRGAAGSRPLSRSLSSNSLVSGVDALTFTGYSTMESTSPRRHLSPIRAQKGIKTAISGDSEPEVSELVQDFLGENAKIGYQLALSMLTYSGLVAYTQVFVQSIMSQMCTRPSECESQPFLPTVAFTLIVVPLSCLNLDEQVTGQVVMSIFRFVSLAVLFFGLLWAIYMVPAPSGLSVSHSHDKFPHSRVDMPLIHMAGFGVMFSTGVFSQLFQHSVPGLIRPLAAEHKADVPSIFGWALATTCLLYIAIGVAACWHLGDEIQQSINLNFVGFKWGLPKDSRLAGAADALSTLVVIFPVLDTISIFPLIANTLGSNLHAAFPKLLNALAMYLIPFVKLFMTFNEGNDSRLDAHTVAERRTRDVLWRFIAAIPPIVASLVVTDLSLTLQVAGICGVFVALVIPSLLHIAVIRRVDESLELIPIHPYKSFGSRVWMPTFILYVSFGAMSVCIWQLVNTVYIY